MHKTDGVSLVNPSEILAKLLEAIPKEIPIAKNKYPNKVSWFHNYWSHFAA